MKNLLKNIQPVDIISIIILVIGMVLKLKGADGMVSMMMTSVVFYYYGKKGFEYYTEDKSCKNDDTLQTK